ncbi:MAG TPA: iron uptake system protein EfeO [Solirubrobacterales bacterium]|jgi:iron uptake system component EfeO
MNRTTFRTSLIAVGIGLTPALMAGCGSNEDVPKGALKLSFELTDAGCVPNTAKAAAGPITFEVENAGTSAVSEFEVLEGDTILGEKENLSDGFSASFSLTLDAGEYTLYCPGGSDERGTLVVSGASKATATAPGEKDAIEQYRDYFERSADELVEETEPFAKAVIAGNVVEAKSLYAAARTPYERIEPVAESFGDLDPRIDGRENDVSADEFEGFHRIEKALWAEGTTGGVEPVAAQLLADVRELKRKVKTVDLQAAQIANGANELLGEVSASKITGEEERYSHLDLVDFEANVEGAEAAFDAVEPLVKNPELVKEIEEHFADVQAALKPYRRGDGFVSYTELSGADTRKLAQEIDALAEELSQVPAQIVG